MVSLEQWRRAKGAWRQVCGARQRRTEAGLLMHSILNKRGAVAER